MPLQFSQNWNFYDLPVGGARDRARTEGRHYDYYDVFALIKQSIGTQQNNYLRQIIDHPQGVARVINGPHSTPGGDKRLHITITIKRGNVKMDTVHVYVPTGEYAREPVSGANPKLGHPVNDGSAPACNNYADLSQQRPPEVT